MFFCYLYLCYAGRGRFKDTFFAGFMLFALHGLQPFPTVSPPSQGLRRGPSGLEKVLAVARISPASVSCPQSLLSEAVLPLRLSDCSASLLNPCGEFAECWPGHAMHCKGIFKHFNLAPIGFCGIICVWAWA